MSSPFSESFSSPNPQTEHFRLNKSPPSSRQAKELGGPYWMRQRLERTPASVRQFPCGEATLETREHILRECPRYEQHRNILREADPNIALSEILGTREGIEALTKFLKASGAFTRTGNSRGPRAIPLFADEPEPASEDEDDRDEGG